MVKKSPWIPIIWAVVGIVSFVLLLNLTFGFVEPIPDNLQWIGNIDEVTATLGLLGAFTFFTKVNPIKLITGK
jgi:hypothetical protein